MKQIRVQKPSRQRPRPKPGPGPLDWKSEQRPQGWKNLGEKGVQER